MKPATKAVSWIATLMIAGGNYVNSAAMAGGIDLQPNEVANAPKMVLAFKPANDRATLVLSGEIGYGDEARVAKALANADAGKMNAAPIRYLYLNSIGGNVFAARKIAMLVQERGIATVIANDAKCASACFMIFAAGAKRFFSATSSIGVHSAANYVANAEGGDTPVETERAASITVLMARDYETLGVPYAIIGRMVTAAPGEMAWIKATELGDWAKNF